MNLYLAMREGVYEGGGGMVALVRGYTKISNYTKPYSTRGCNRVVCTLKKCNSTYVKRERKRAYVKQARYRDKTSDLPSRDDDERLGF